MDTRKTTLIATIAVIALLAVGIGYAYTAYTSNHDNSTDVAYVTLSQTGNGAYKFAEDKIVQFDTFNFDTDKYYYQIANKKTLTVSGLDYICAELGALTLTASANNASDAGQYLDITIPSSDGFDGTGNWIYFIVGDVVNNASTTLYAYKNTPAETPEWTDGPTKLYLNKGNTTDYGSKTIYIWYGYLSTKADVVIGNDRFLKDTNEPEELIGADIIFKGVDGANVPQPTPLVTPLENYQVTYNSNYGDVPATKADYTALTDEYILKDLAWSGFETPAGKSFVGWNTNKNATTALEGDQNVIQNTVYYAIWANSP